MKKITYDEIESFTENLGYKFISKEYKNIYSKLILKDKLGYYYITTVINLNQEKEPKKFSKYNSYTIQNLKLWCELNNKPFKIISEDYEKMTKHLNWKCLKKGCEEYFSASLLHILGDEGCSYCNGKKVGLSNCLATKNPELVKEWHPTKNGDLTPYDVTYGSKKYIWWKCSKNPKHEWKTKVCNRSNKNYGRNCPYCAGKLPSEDYNLLTVNPEICEEWDYVKNGKNPEECTPYSNKHVWWKCKECKHEWFAVIASRTKNIGCPKCNESKGEKELDRILTKYDIPHDSQYTFNDLRGIGNGMLKFDTPVFWDKEKTKLRLLIEYDGEQHYKPIRFNGISEKVALQKFKQTQQNDQIKNKYCENNNIILVRIPYWDFDNIENILQKTFESSFLLKI